VDGRRWLSLEGTPVVSEEPARVAEAVRRYAQRYRTPSENPSRVVLEDKRSLYALLGPGREVALKLGARFSLDHAGLLREAFDQVELQTWEREIVVPTPEPIEAYVASTGADPEVREQAAAQVREVIARNGAFRTTSVVGIFVCQ